MALVGDAAHVSSPMTASGFHHSLLDVLSLRQALAGIAGGEAVAPALTQFERARLADDRRRALYAATEPGVECQRRMGGRLSALPRFYRSVGAGNIIGNEAANVGAETISQAFEAIGGQRGDLRCCYLDEVVFDLSDRPARGRTEPAL
jgi:2-polyprenyl-6-methoxyphenol hydroxylase-like FAD-dependent oxidoreductase